MYVQGSNLLKWNLRLLDGEKTIRDLLVEDEKWVVEHLMADTGDWLPGREVLVPPELLQQPLPSDGVVPVEISREKMEACDDITADEPVSRQKSYSVASYVGPLPSWSCDWNPHLRSLRELIGYSVTGHGADDGTVEDGIIWCGDTWTLRYLVVDMGSFFSPRRFLLPTPVIRKVDWTERKIEAYTNQQTLSVVPEYGGLEQLTADVERDLHRIYQGRPGSWWQEGERHG